MGLFFFVVMNDITLPLLDRSCSKWHASNVMTMIELVTLLQVAIAQCVFI
jgi:hypothetical protein